MSKDLNFSEKEYSEIIEMALSDHIPFSTIKKLYGLREKEVKKIMRTKLKPKSYKNCAYWKASAMGFCKRYCS
jgi:uncharacterized protein (TIGR03643 family)